MSAPLLEARSLTVTFDRAGEAVPVLRNLSFSLEAGHVMGIVGESGAGKTMIGRTIAQMLPHGFQASGGTLEFQGETLLGLPHKRHRALLGTEIAFVPQESVTALNPVLTIGRQLFEHLERLGVPRQARQTRAVELLEAVHMPTPAALLQRYPHQLSGGMCQRVLIAMAFAGQPKLVIADEPTTALDVTIQARIMRIMVEMTAQRGSAVILITHDLRLAAHVCDQIMVLYAGSPVEIGPTKQVFGTPRHPYTRCLQLTNPPLSGPRRELIALPDRMPGLAELARMRGCRFAARCSLVEARCEMADPPFVEVGASQRAACHFAARTSEIAPGHTNVLLRPGAPQAGQEPILRIENLLKRFVGERHLFRPSNDDVVAVRDVSFELYPHEFLGIVGESGSGKSTIAKLIVGLERPSAGRIVLAGRDVTEGDDAAAHAHRVATVQMIFQDTQSALNPRRRVARIVTQAMEAGRNRASWRDRLARALLLLAEIGMPGDAAERFPAQLSGGQRQRVNIARALCAVPKLLVADEIVSGLDVSVQAQLLNLLLRLKRERQIALLFISHDLSVMRYLCDRVLVMYCGAIVESGSAESVFAEPRHDYTKALLSAVPPDDLARRWKALETLSENEEYAT